MGFAPTVDQRLSRRTELCGLSVICREFVAVKFSLTTDFIEGLIAIWCKVSKSL